MSSRWIPPVLLLLTLIPLPSSAQEPARHRFDGARFAWDRGEYAEALGVLEDLLLDPTAGFLQNEIALLTGEVHRVFEVTADGRAVRWSPDGRMAAYESGSGPDVLTHVVRVTENGTEEVVQVRGTGLVFSPDGREVALLVLEEDSALEAARNRLREELSPTDRAGFMRLREELARLDARHTHLMVVELASKKERVVRPAGIGVQSLLYEPVRGELLFLGSVLDGTAGGGLFRVTGDAAAEAVAPGLGLIEDPVFARAGHLLVFGSGAGSIGVLDRGSGGVRALEGVRPVVSADGGTLAFLGGGAGEWTVNVLSLLDPGAAPRVVARTDFPLAEMSSRSCPSCPLLSGLAVSPNGSAVAFQGMPREDWELFLTSTDGENPPARFTREIQHDLFPQFLGTGLLLATKGEGRHRRSYLYDPQTGEGTRLFRNNTTRTVAPEYEWAPSPDGGRLLIVAERDGNTVSPERGVYLLDLGQTVDREELLARVRGNLAAEEALLAKATRMYGPLEEEIRPLVERISVPRLFDYQENLFRFGSKFITEPGNRLAIEYLSETLMGFGHTPDLQWFEPRGTRTANVVVRIPGTVSPEVVYAISAHFDSNLRSPGADDNGSATVGLLEMARVLAAHPLPATVEIAFFTGEEAGLLGSREYVRRAVASEKKLVGALNNDMIGWAENHRLDNTIRYSNDGIRDVQHGAAILFSDLITYDAKYYKSTDAAAYFDAYGDIVGGIGSYPILANPHYHQVHDILETVNHQLVAEVAKVTLASTVLLASSPSRITGLAVEGEGRSVRVSWAPAVESDVTHYEVVYGPRNDPQAHRLTVPAPAVELTDLDPGMSVAVRAVNRRGLVGWDWARAPLR